ncbi:hypothetical protein FPSE_12295 [Fusarium pseudograminearum CS3096]|uniref:Uncharacterized protein n=1 Tax=Fusarium pseudograminearum (strain CS3096) TaxID=1028729 RepID=K3V3Z1_FUSPC|nr:hypothetical protein FPSE_12295 [Fusarium pseudograminearum CS3096]EKJ67534.1 hypothetical protein FPSE_12295 [Fusarium pseudograminearum CS3096]
MDPPPSQPDQPDGMELDVTKPIDKKPIDTKPVDTKLVDTKPKDPQATPYIKAERSPSPPGECSPKRPDLLIEDLEFLTQKTIPKRVPAAGRSITGLRASNTTAQFERAHVPTRPFDDDNTGTPYPDEDSADERQERLDGEDLDFKLDEHSEHDSDDDVVFVKTEKSSNSKSNGSLEPTTRQPVVRTAREYRQRELQREKEAENKKRKLNEDQDGPRKVRKASTKSSAGEGSRNLAGLMANSLHGMDGIDESFANGSVPSMGSIQASSKWDQVKQMINSVCKDLDNRQTKTQKAELKEAMVSFGYRKVEEANGKWRLSGLSLRMESHQLTAAQWMIKREAKELSPAGGILADDTGMGKTISTLACMVSHPAEPQDIREFSRATLVVLPNRGMVTQWEGQIEKFCYCTEAADTLRFSRAQNKKPPWWGGQWVVLTTYAELVSQSVKPAVINRLRSEHRNDEKGFKKALDKKLGLLFNVRWYRVILDEGQAIKNRESSTALACCLLTAKYRWVLTATPISNGLQEFYPYLKFIGCSFTQTPAEFVEQYMTGENAEQNIRFVVCMVMLRRTHKDTFLGKKITNLPPSKCHDLWVTPPSWELTLSQAMDNQHRVKGLEADVKKDTANNDDISGELELTDSKDAKSMTAQVTRMRQAASHPFNLEKFLQESKHQGKIEWILEQYKGNAQKPSIDAEQQVEDAIQWEPFLPGQHQLETEYPDVSGDITDMTKLLSLAANEHNIHGLDCPLCDEEIEPKKFYKSKNCEHVYCSGCVKFGLKKAREGRPEDSPDQCLVNGCSVELVRASPPKTPQCILKAVRALKDYKEPGTDSIGSQWLGEGKGTDCFFAATCGREDIDFDPVRMPWGAKLTATVQVILTWLQKSPNDKIIVFIEFTITAKVLGCILERLGLEFLYYNQIASTQAKKDKAYRKFQKDPKVRILVASMKCGGTGLNLQVANLVIIDDIWFNTTVEQQAFGRVHRIGQKKETRLVRILARGTIDERLIMLQDAKAEIVRRVLQDDGHEPTFSDDLQLRMLLTTKDKDTMVNDMEKEAVKRKGRPKKTAAKASVKKGAKTGVEARKTKVKAKVTKKA